MLLQWDAARTYVRDHIRWFKPEELICKCGCGLLVVDTDFLHRLDALRESLGIPLVLTSVCRCARHNAASGGSENSDHLTGQGADVRALNSATRFALVDRALSLGFRRIGIAKSFVHLGALGSPNPQDVMWLY